MKRIIAIGDIHGRTIWKDIVKQEFDLCIFLGDYVDSHDGISAEEQEKNLLEILDFKENNPSKVILLRGNHDCRSLGYYWAECSPSDPAVNKFMMPLKDRFLKDTQWIYIKDNIIFSHAGISKVWMERSGIQSIKYINNYLPTEIFGFTPEHRYDYSGYSDTQPPTWIRPQNLIECNVEGYTQVVGHTPFAKIVCNEASNGEYIWFCDTLEDKYYLVIDNNIFTPIKYESTSI